MLLWLGELIISSWVLSYGAEHLSMKYGAKFVGRTLLSIATTLPEIAIVIYAAADGFYGIAIGAGLGSNLLMMTLGSPMTSPVGDFGDSVTNTTTRYCPGGAPSRWA